MNTKVLSQLMAVPYGQAQNVQMGTGQFFGGILLDLMEDVYDGGCGG